MHTHDQQPWKYCYWLDPNHFLGLQNELQDKGIETTCAQYAPCEALKGDIGYAEPHVWPVLCKSDATPWYNQSAFFGKTLIVSSFPLHDRYEPFLQTTITPSTFQTPYMPTLEEKEKLSEDSVYLSQKPKPWNQFPEEWSEEMVKGFSEMSGNPSITFEDILLRWNAVHANFINPSYRAGESYLNAPYSIDESKYISTCCVELFNLFDSREQALLVRPCIGAVIADVLADNQYYQVDIRRSGI